MNDEQKERIESCIIKLVEKVTGSVEQGCKELPEAFQQYLRWRSMESVIWNTIRIGVMVVSGVASYYMLSHGWFDMIRDPMYTHIEARCPANWSTMITGWITLIVTVISGFAAVFGFNTDFIEIKIAPKAVALEYCRKLIN